MSNARIRRCWNPACQFHRCKFTAGVRAAAYVCVCANLQHLLGPRLFGKLASRAQPRVQPSFRALFEPRPSPLQALSHRAPERWSPLVGSSRYRALWQLFLGMVQEGQKREREEELEGPPRELDHTPRARTPQPVLEAIPEEDLEEEMVGPVLPQPKKRKVRTAICRRAGALGIEDVENTQNAAQKATHLTLQDWLLTFTSAPQCKFLVLSSVAGPTEIVFTITWWKVLN